VRIAIVVGTVTVGVVTVVAAADSPIPPLFRSTRFAARLSPSSAALPSAYLVI